MEKFWKYWAIAVGVAMVIGIAATSCDNHSLSVTDILNKDPNTWTDRESSYVDGFFDWMDDNG